MKTVRDILKNFNSEDAIKFIFVADFNACAEGKLEKLPIYMVTHLNSASFCLKEANLDGKRYTLKLEDKLADGNIVIRKD